jgi:hypothetical protein
MAKNKTHPSSTQTGQQKQDGQEKEDLEHPDKQRMQDTMATGYNQSCHHIVEGRACSKLQF